MGTKRREITLKKIFEDALYAMFFVDNQGFIKYANKRYAQMCKTSKEKIIGKNIEEVCKDGFIHVLKTGEAEFGKILNIHGEITVVNKIPIRENGKIVGAVGLALCDNLSQFKGLLKRIEELERNAESYRQQLKDIYSARYTLSNIIGESKAIKIVKKKAVEASKYTFPVLITGESGTGKELFAHGIHQMSAQKKNNFIRINCAAIPKDLFEAELFGYEPGAFSGAGKNGKPGKIELAHEGTLFLDEISDLPLEMQAKLLRVLQEKEVERVGGKTIKHIDFRLITATNRNLEKMVKEKSFREDLFYRLNVIHIHIPPLRERLEDILPISQHILEKLSKDQGVSAKKLSKNALDILMNYHWPGNVRELINVLQYAVINAKNSTIDIGDLPPGLVNNSLEASVVFDRHYFKNIAKEAEKYALCYLIKRAGYNVNKAAAMIGVHRTGLYKKLKKYRLRVHKSGMLISQERANKEAQKDPEHIFQRAHLFSHETAFLENFLQSFN